MPDEFLSEVSLAVRYVRDVDTRPPNPSNAPFEPGAGTYEVGFVTGGAFVPFYVLKGGGVQKKIKAAKAKADELAAASAASGTTTTAG